VAVIRSLSEQLAGLEAALTEAFCALRDAAIVQSQPGLWVVLGAQVLAEFVDDLDRYASATARKAYAGTAQGVGVAARARGATQHQVLRALGNRLAGILHGCLRRRRLYDEQLAWPTPPPPRPPDSGEGVPGEGHPLPPAYWPGQGRWPRCWSGKQRGGRGVLGSTAARKDGS
jgi:hypothetical protein